MHWTIFTRNLRDICVNYYLTIRLVARKGFGSIAHSIRLCLMGYWPMALEGEWSSYPGLGLGFGFLFFFVQSQIALWSLERMRHFCMRTVHGISRSCHREKLARIPNGNTVRGRPTLKVVKLRSFSERVGLHGLPEINLRANILSEFIKNHVIPKELSTGAINSSTR